MTDRHTASPGAAPAGIAAEDNREIARMMVENSLDALLLTKPDGRIVAANPAACRMLGRSEAEIVAGGRNGVADAADPRLAAGLAERARTGRFDGELTCLRADGSRFPAEVASRVFTDSSGEHWTSIAFRDISARVTAQEKLDAAEQALRESETRHRLLLQSAGVGIVYVDVAGRMLLANTVAATLLGTTPDALLGKTAQEIVGEGAGGVIAARIAEAAASGEYRSYETCHELPWGSRWVTAHYNRVSSLDGGPGGVQIIFTDITEQKRVELALRESREHYQRLFATMSEGFALHEIVCDAAGRPVDYRFLDANAAFFQLTGLPESVLGRTVREAVPEIEELWIQRYGRVALDGTPVHFDQYAGPLGRHYEVRAYSPRHGQFATVFFDVTEQRRAELAERKRMQQLQAINSVGLKLSARLELRDLLSTAVEEIRRAFDYYNVGILVHDPARGELGDQAMAGALETLAGPEYRLPVGTGLIGTAARDGATVLANDVTQDSRYVEGFPQRCATRAEIAVPVMLGNEVLAVLDVQEERTEAFDESDVLTLETLARVIAVAIHNARLFAAAQHQLEERARTEEQLRHAQKMEAVGRLAGGVAHDFNNLLQALLSYTTLLRSPAADPERVHRIADDIVQHIHRGAALTRQLLLFSRRSATRPEPADLNVLAKASGGFLRHLLRENIAFSVETTAAPVIVAVDPGQFDQVLMNLAVNASDAMPDGGRLTIRVAGSDPDWAELTVEDSGHGIPENLREMIFEPFFTTKEIGHGTGLGLSVVHGIVAEHGGRIAVESRLGAGTAFRIHLPRLEEGQRRTPAPADEREPDLLSGKGEWVLVVEDEEAARQGLAELLSMMGYRVAVAGSAEEAAALVPERPWDLLLTDLMLPGATGITLAGTLTELLAESEGRGDVRLRRGREHPARHRRAGGAIPAEAVRHERAGA